MKPTTEGSKAMNFDIVCMSFGKENKRGLKVVQGASKNSIFNEDMTLNAKDGELRANNTLQLENGNIISFEEKAFERVKRNRKLKAEKGVVLDFEEIYAKENEKIVSLSEEKQKRSSKKQQERGA